MWMICQDDKVEEAKRVMVELFKSYGMHTSDVDPVGTVDELDEIVTQLEEGRMPSKMLPLDVHIIEYSKFASLLDEIPFSLLSAMEENQIPYLPIHPISLRKTWQYDDEAYNFIYDFLSAFTAFNFPEELQQSLNNSRLKVINEHTSTELFDFLMQSANKATFRRFQAMELEERFLKRVEEWKLIKEDNQEISDSKTKSKSQNISLDDEFFK